MDTTQFAPSSIPVSLLWCSDSIPFIFYSTQLSYLNGPFFNELKRPMNLLFSAFCHDSVKRANDFYNSCRILVYVDLRTIMDEFASWGYWGCYDEMEISVKYRYGKVVKYTR